MNPLHKIHAFAFKASLAMQFKSIRDKDFKTSRWLVFAIRSVRIYRPAIERERERERKLKDIYACVTRSLRRQNFMSHATLRLKIYRHLKKIPLRFLSNSIYRKGEDVISNFESSLMPLAEWRKRSRERERGGGGGKRENQYLLLRNKLRFRIKKHG